MLYMADAELNLVAPKKGLSVRNGRDDEARPTHTN